MKFTGEEIEMRDVVQAFIDKFENKEGEYRNFFQQWKDKYNENNNK